MNRLRIITFLAAVVLGAAPAFSAPPQPVFPNPANGATNVPVDAQLYWSLGEQELIVNGGFESGNFNGWSKENQGGDSFINNGTYLPMNGQGPLPPYAGGFCSTTDQNGPGFETIYQDVSIPTNATSAVLRWVDRMRNLAGAFFNPPNPQRFHVQVRTLTGALLETLFVTETGDNPFSDWTKRSADMRHYAGQRVRVAFVCDVTRAPFQLLLDNVSLVVQAIPATRYDVYFGTNSTLTASNLVGTASNGSWRLPPLQPATTYYWRVNPRQGTEIAIGPVWQFRTHPRSDATLLAWSAIASPQSADQPVPVELSALDAGHNRFTNSVPLPAPLPLQAFRVSADSYHLLESEPPSAFASYERTTIGYSFTPDTDLMITGFRTYSGEKVSLWETNGVLITSAALNGPAGVWTETPITPIGLAAGRTYVLGAYSAGLTTNFARFEAGPDFAHGTVNQAFEGNGDAMPMAPHPARWWLVDLVYSPSTGDSLSITPNSINSIPGGVWRGPITFHERAPRVFLRAGTSFLSGMFALVDAPLRISSITYNGGVATITFNSVSGESYILQRSATGLPNSWTPVNSPLAGTGSPLQISDSTAVGFVPARLYRLIAQ
jgi:hypothetical protein